jgi:hypothetical protein
MTADPSLTTDPGPDSGPGPRPGPRTLVLGDSWVHGLSKGQGTMSRLLPAAVGASAVLDLSKISRVATDVVADHLPEIDAFGPDFALVAIGGADSLVFPAAWMQRLIDRFAPPDWHGREGLMPPAIQPRDRRKRIRQRIGVVGKAIIKQIMINVFGGRRRTPLDEFEAAARRILGLLAVHDATVVLVGCTYVDRLTFPRSTTNIKAAHAVLHRLAEEFPAALYVDAAGMVEEWTDYLPDRVHLTRDGHRRVTDGVLAAMTVAGGRWAAALAPRVADGQSVAR